ncbi:hypothetical protein A7U60_g334 [Sanghuangporus baumii]|uniref:Uncharacterized protein n=1 Tax=Sanghuangporus baumii TaxID=108892 RepID=A0A9Q5NFE7_SANBA|nr:hypothetical protein A7U60_g334 [Sanghuangporus baumii]
MRIFLLASGKVTIFTYACKDLLLRVTNKVWIQGHAEKIQKKLDAPIEEFSFSLPKSTSFSDKDLLKITERKVSQSHFSGTSNEGSSNSSSSFTRHKRPRTSETSPPDLPTGGSERHFRETEKEAYHTPIAYSGTSAMRQIVDSIVNANVALSTPPASRSCSPHDGLKPRRRLRQSSQSRPTSRTNSPNPGTRPSTPIPSGWTAPSSRHSFRRFDIRPWGPRHLEYDYNQARKEFQAAAYYALGQYGYEPPKGIGKYKAPAPEFLPSMDDLRRIPDFAKACRKLDYADRALEEALFRGETWENTPIPEKYLKLSLEDAVPEDLCIQRRDNTATQDRSRSSVTLEEAAGQFDSSLLARSSTAPTSVPSSASASEKGTMSAAGDDIRSSRGTSPLAKMTLSDESLPPPVSSSTPQNIGVAPDAGAAHKHASDDASSQAQRHSGITSGVSNASSSRKRLLSEVEIEGGANLTEVKDQPKETGVILQVPTRAYSPDASRTKSGKEVEGSLGRTESESTTGSGSALGFVEMGSAGDSPPTSVSSAMSKETHSRTRGGRVGRMRGRKRGLGRGR